MKAAIDMLNQDNMDGEQRQQVLKDLGVARRYPGLEQLICAALANPDFAARLLDDTAAALQYIPESIHLSPVEYQLIISVIGANDIHDFASRLYAKAWQAKSDDI